MAYTSPTSSASQPATSLLLTLADVLAVASKNHSECHLLRLPAELRNEIFRLGLDAGSSVEVTEVRWPGITGACKAIRAETLPMYLGSADLIAHVRDLNSEPLFHWLRIITGLSLDEKRLIKSVVFDCCGTIHQREHSNASIDAEPTLDFWDEVIFRIHISGLKADQVSWTGIETARLALMDPDAAEIEAAEVFILQAWVLMPLLAYYGLEPRDSLSNRVAEQIIDAGILPMDDDDVYNESDVCEWALDFVDSRAQFWHINWAERKIQEEREREAEHSEGDELEEYEPEEYELEDEDLEEFELWEDYSEEEGAADEDWEEEDEEGDEGPENLEEFLEEAQLADADFDEFEEDDV